MDNKPVKEILPMMRRLLLTSFSPWKPEHVSNSSDDLLGLLQTQVTGEWATQLDFVRQLPVDFEAAPREAIAHFQRLQPDAMVCFGMAETRDRLNLERQAVWEEQLRHTRLDLSWLAAGLAFTDISDDAGGFVCNRLYHALLEHFQGEVTPPSTAPFALFIHVPPLTEDNRAPILQDSWEILQRLLLTENPFCPVPSVAQPAL